MCTYILKPNKKKCILFVAFGFSFLILETGDFLFKYLIGFFSQQFLCGVKEDIEKKCKRSKTKQDDVALVIYCCLVCCFII